MYLGIDTSNYTTSAAAFDGRDGVNRSRLLDVAPGQLGLRQSDALFSHVKRLPVLMEQLFSAVSPGEIQAVAVLCLLQERKQREAAKILGIGLPLVKYRLRRARELLAQSLGKEALP